MDANQNLPDLRLRAATLADAEPIANLGARVFSATFRDVTAAEDLRLFLAATYTPARLALDLMDAARHFIVAHVGASLAGFCQMRMGAADPSVVGPRPVELQRLYVDGPWHGVGVAQALMQHGIAWAKGHAYETLWLGVGDTNFRAQRFYQKFGLRRCGEHIFYVGTDPQTDFIMAGPLGGLKTPGSAAR